MLSNAADMAAKRLGGQSAASRGKLRARRLRRQDVQIDQVLQTRHDRTTGASSTKPVRVHAGRAGTPFVRVRRTRRVLVD